MFETAYKYSLEAGSKKFQCPNCQKKTFVRYVNNVEGDYLPENYGRCDREQKCGYHQTPSDNKPLISSEPHLIEKPEPSFLPLEYVDLYFDMEMEASNNFVQYLYSILPKRETDIVIRDYLISTIKYWNKGATIFWQIDEREKVRSGQVILYDREHGKRIKKPYNHITWIHSILEKRGEIKDFHLEQCLFGIHLINRKPKQEMIAIVEAPKTACIMAILYPKYIWLATCGLSNIKTRSFKPLRSKKIVMYPDLGAYDKWVEKANQLKKFGFDIEVSKLLEEKANGNNDGYDLADFYTDEIKKNNH